MDTARQLQAAQGYLELGMIEDALEELDRLPEKERHAEFAVCIRLDILNSAKRWKDAAKVAREGVVALPGCPHLYIMGAYAIRRAEDSVQAAVDFLLGGRPCMADGVEQAPLFWFNLGCYHAQLGNRNDALDCVNVAVEMEPSYKKLAMSDPDLEPVRDDLEVDLEIDLEADPD